MYHESVAAADLIGNHTLLENQLVEWQTNCSAMTQSQRELFNVTSVGISMENSNLIPRVTDISVNQYSVTFKITCSLDISAFLT